MGSLSLVESFNKGNHLSSQLWKRVRPVIFCKMHVWLRPISAISKHLLLMRGRKLRLVSFCSASVQYDWVWKHATGLEKSCQMQLSSFDPLSATKCLADNFHLNISKWETSWQSQLTNTNSLGINSGALLGWLITIYCRHIFQFSQGNPIYSQFRWICLQIWWRELSIYPLSCECSRTERVVCRETGGPAGNKTAL